MGFGLTGCTPANTGGAAAQGWKAGTYSANVTGHNAPFTVDVTFSENAITAIDTSTNQESLGVGASALEDLSNKIMEYQTLNVDSVTGATLSSMSLQQGVKDCAVTTTSPEPKMASTSSLKNTPTMPIGIMDTSILMT